MCVASLDLQVHTGPKAEGPQPCPTALPPALGPAIPRRSLPASLRDHTLCSPYRPPSLFPSPLPPLHRQALRSDDPTRPELPLLEAAASQLLSLMPLALAAAAPHAAPQPLEAWLGGLGPALPPGAAPPAAGSLLLTGGGGGGEGLGWAAAPAAVLASFASYDEANAEALPVADRVSPRATPPTCARQPTNGSCRRTGAWM
jgi:hypothetical protein